MVLNRSVISVFFRGGNILTDFLGGGEYEEKKHFVFLTHKKHKNTKNLYFKKIRPLPPCPPNDISKPIQNISSLSVEKFFHTHIFLGQTNFWKDGMECRLI